MFVRCQTSNHLEQFLYHNQQLTEYNQPKTQQQSNWDKLQPSELKLSLEYEMIKIKSNPKLEPLL